MGQSVVALYDLLTSGNLISPQELHGLDYAQIAELEADQGISFPAAYREFLSIAGAGAGRLWVGSVAFYPSLLGVKAEALALLRENNVVMDLDRAVVILIHQGYQFLYLPTDGDDPPVCQWIEGDLVAVEIAPDFTTLLAWGVAEISFIPSSPTWNPTPPSGSTR